MPNTKLKGARALLQAAVTLMMTGVENDLPTGTKAFPFDGSSTTPAQAVTQFQTWLAAASKVQAAKVAYMQAVADLRGLTPGVRILMRAIRAWAIAQFGSTNAPALANFGITIKPRKVLTVATKAHGQAKRHSTVTAKAAAAGGGPSVSLVVGANGVQFATPAAPSAPAPTPAPTGGK
jgi:hypothetical protein